MRVLAPGRASGEALVLDEPLSFWGGVDPETGVIIEPSHAQYGENVAGRVLVMAHGRGSSSSSSVLAEMLRRGTGPAAIVLHEPDSILAIGSLVASVLYGVVCPVVVTDRSVGIGIWEVDADAGSLATALEFSDENADMTMNDQTG